MQAFLNGNEVALNEIAGNATVGVVVDAVKGAIPDKGSILLEIACDGRTIHSEQITQILNRPATEYQRIECRSGNPAEIVVTTLNASLSVLAESKASALQAAEDLASGSLGPGMQRLIDCVEIWSQAHEAMINSGALLQFNFEELVIADRHIFDWLRDLGGKLKDIRDAIENRDHVLLGDILRYETEEFVEGWERMLNAYIEHVEKTRVAA